MRRGEAIVKSRYQYQQYDNPPPRIRMYSSFAG
jgi:hypothetical protein